MRVGSLFSGIGGLDLGLERAGMSVAWQCEIDPYCRAVLAHHWPGVLCWDDIRAIDESAERVDLICGGFPCQPVSLAGKGLAQKDPRWLWPEFARVVGFLRPRYVLVENVPGLVRRGLSDVVGDLAQMGYDAEWQIVSAASVGAPHLRERLILVAYPRGEQYEGTSYEDAGATSTGLFEAPADTNGGGLISQEQDIHAGQSNVIGSSSTLEDANSQSRLQWRPAITGEEETGRARPDASGRGVRGIGEWFPEPDVGRVADGVPNRVAQLRALGNAVVPQVAEFVGRLILEAEGARCVAA